MRRKWKIWWVWGCTHHEKHYLSSRITNLVEWWTKCIESYGHYGETWHTLYFYV